MSCGLLFSVSPTGSRIQRAGCFSFPVFSPCFAFVFVYTLPLCCLETTCKLKIFFLSVFYSLPFFSPPKARK